MSVPLHGRPPIAAARPAPEVTAAATGDATDAATGAVTDLAARAAYSAAGELLKALSAPLRIEIVMLLSERGAQCVHELVDVLGVAQPLASQHLRVLRSAGVVVAQRRGREVAYSLADEHVARIVADAVSHVQEPR